MQTEEKSFLSKEDLWINRWSTFGLYFKQTEEGKEEFLVQVDIWADDHINSSKPYYIHRINGLNFTGPSRDKELVLDSYNGRRS